MLRSVNAKLSSMKFVFVRRWRNLITEMQTSELPIAVVKMIQINITISMTILAVPDIVDAYDSSSAIVSQRQNRRVEQKAEEDFNVM